ncbi:glycosyltransferase [Longimicrobium terrae]|uniref:Glycosyltransferase involved in cell wall biosynthesis n=1 Tax=Longimicrobium terrae TaxID=1639882 RepID=A0A841H3E0_9BACT|nr:glycosyltransferase [Longimicrobium terrae]MBB4638121.1 glycosyltransferase involved in cell wall biosynthesis [Longimicrobium terrae]MBB6072493.1 glycosyltransferase involved in cell wall biosynthesis [Longimicrobium terrae]NNC32096.1 glycosyltransferase [Longimicrobium terrae]
MSSVSAPRPVRRALRPAPDWSGRVVLYHNVVAPYRHALFQELARRMALDVWFSVRTTRDRKWSTRVPAGYDHRFLDGWSVYGFNRPLIFCPGLIRDLRRARPQAVIAVLTRSNAVDVLRICRWGRRAGVPVVLWIGAVEPDPAFTTDVPRALDRLFERYYRKAIREATGYVYYSELSRRWAERRGARGPGTSGTQVLPPAPVPPRLEAHHGRDDLVMLYVGKLEHRKGVDLLIRAAADLEPEVRRRLLVRIAGEGPMAAMLPELTEAGIRYEFLGHTDRDELWKVYRDADLTVLASRHDPWANILNESMSMGTPVLISRQAGGAELGGRAGWVCDLRDPASLPRELARALAECRDSGRRRDAVRAEREYRPDTSADRIATLMRQLVDGPAVPERLLSRTG